MRIGGAVRRERTLIGLLALVAYLPALLSSPGRMPADTKLYLYLDPGRLLSTSAHTWDPSLYGGWVPHQMAAFLWPSGPWFWCCERLGLPDWVAHRLWLGTILFLGGLGILKLVKALGLPLKGMAVAALVYQLSPYILPYVSRTSVMLLPWAGVGWMVLLTMRSVRRGGWRDPALLTLVVCTVAPVNATAFAMVLPGPVLWLLFEWRSQRISLRKIGAAAARVGVLAIPASAWWVVMLSIQGRYGADVLRYSETLSTVSRSAISTEVVRSLGYWLFYLRDPYAPSTTSSLPYQDSVPLILISFALVAVCLSGLVLTRFRHRRYAIALVVCGVLLSVGVHPFASPAPLPSLLRDTGIGLALRSSTRALPLVSLGMALGAAALVVAVSRGAARRHRLFPFLVVGLVTANLPSLWTADLVDPALARDQDPPAEWQTAAAALDASGTAARVLQLPGADFGAFRWGFTVDQPLSGLTLKPVLTRDLLPLGSPQLMDLLYALDNHLQGGTLPPEALAPVARFLSSDRVWVSNDLEFDRFRTPRPEIFAAFTSEQVQGLVDATEFGTRSVNRPTIPMVDEVSLSDARVGTPVAPVMLFTVDDAAPLLRIGGRTVILDGSGDGIVASAAAGVLDGSESVRYAADLTDADWAGVGGETLLVVTDSNRDREQHWRGTQDSLGMTESGGASSDGLRDVADQRLELFDTTDAQAQTTAALDGTMTVQASAYGDPYAYTPENRAAMAVDGDPATAWRVPWQQLGETLHIDGAAPRQLHLLQAQGPHLLRMITDIDISVDGAIQHVVLGEASLSGAGQTVDIPRGDHVAITITATAPRPGAPPTGQPWVGLAEIGVTAQEWVRPPSLVLAHAAAEQPLELVFTRDRTRPTNRWRSDPEPVLARVVTLPHEVRGKLSITLRLDARAEDDVIDQLLGTTVSASSNRRLTGVPAARASAAFDGNPSSAWITPFDAAVGSALTVDLEPGSTVTSFDISQPSGDYSRITELRVSIDGGEPVAVEVPPAAADGRTTVAVEAMTGDTLTIEVAAVENAFSTDRQYGEQTLLPAAIAEIDGLSVRRTAPTTRDCRDDLLSIDGRPLSIRVDASLLADGAVVAEPCEATESTLAAGEHHILSAAGQTTGIDVDMVRFSAATQPAAASAPAVTVTKQTATAATVVVPPCAEGCWLIDGQGFNPGWQARVDGTSLGEVEPISGGSNGWWLPPATQSRTVTIEFTPQTTFDLAMWVSVLAVLAAVALAGTTLLRRFRPAPVHIESDDPINADMWQLSPPTTVMWAGVAFVAASLLFIGPWWAVAAAVVAAVAQRTRQLRMAGVAAVLGLAGLGSLVAAVELRRSYPAGSGWTDHFTDLHGAGLFLVLLLVVAAFASERDDG